MWKLPAMMMIALLAVAGWLSAAPGDDVAAPAEPQPEALPQAPPEMPGPVPAAGQENEVPRRAAKEFAPWIEAVIQEKSIIATRLFPIRRPAQETLDGAGTLRIFRKFHKLDGLELALIGGRGLGDQAGVLLFTITTESGPVAFKIYHYRFGNTRSVGKIEITDDWAEIERMYITVDPLPAPVLVPL